MVTKKSKLKKSKVATKQQTVNTATSPVPGLPSGQSVDPSSLSIGDLRNLSTVLDVASTRGAFRANEMATVGLVYNKLQAFLAKVTPPEEKKEGASTTGTPATAPTMAPTTAPTSTITQPSTLAQPSTITQPSTTTRPRSK